MTKMMTMRLGDLISWRAKDARFRDEGLDLSCLSLCNKTDISCELNSVTDCLSAVLLLLLKDQSDDSILIFEEFRPIMMKALAVWHMRLIGCHIDGETPLAGFLVSIAHVPPGLPHCLNAYIQRDQMAPVSPQSQRGT